jgi:hypothetical protein
MGQRLDLLMQFWIKSLKTYKLMLYILLLLAGVASQASQVYYNQATGSYEERNDAPIKIRPNEKQRLFVGMKKSMQKAVNNSPWVLPSLSIYTGFSGYQTTSTKLQYKDSTQKTTAQSIASSSISNGNMLVGAELMIPLSRRIKIGGGATHNFETSILENTISSKSGQPFNLQLSNSVYGKFSYKLSRLSIYTLAGMQFSNISFYDSISKDDTTNPWTYKPSKERQSPPTYNFLGKYSAQNAFFGIGTSFKMSPSTSVFLDTTYMTVSGLKGTAESNATVSQVNALKDSQYQVFQTRFGFSFDFIGLATSTI